MSEANLKKWTAALYTRISRDDNSSDYSIENQKKRLFDFVDAYADEFQAMELYADIGASGSNSVREHFSRMLQDIKLKKVNCVIVKDLSRLSRNYYEAGYYLDYFFSSMNIRFISLEYPALDSYKSPELMNSVMIPMQNVVNDDFCRQTSVKIRNILKMKREKGEFVGAFAPYGYSKNPKCKHQLIVDEEAAGVVRMIFQWFVFDCMSQGNITKKLNDLGALSPCAYKQSKGLAYYNHGLSKGVPLWCQHTVRGVLGNQVYIGNMVQGKQKSKSYKYKKRESVPADEWVVVEETHESIINLDVFIKAQRLLEVRVKPPSPEATIYPFSGLMRCGECDKAMHRHTAKKYTYFRCRTYSEQSRTACFGHSIREDKLLNIVQAILQFHTQMAADVLKIQENIKSTPSEHDYNWQISQMIEQKERQLERTSRYKKSLYQDWKDGLLGKEEYKNYRKQYEDEIQVTADSITSLKLERSTIPDQKNEDRLLFRQFSTNLILPELNHAVLFDLIDKITLDGHGDITIHLNFRDLFIEMTI